MTITSLPSGSCFLENIPDIDILTAKTRLLVTIKIGDDTIYDEYLYPADGEVRVIDLADIFRPYARRRLAVTATITIAEQQVPSSGDTDSATVTDTQTANLQVYYSIVDIVGVDCSTFLTTHFLTLLEGHKTTYMGRLEYLHYMGKETAEVTAHYADKTTKNVYRTSHRRQRHIHHHRRFSVSIRDRGHRPSLLRGRGRLTLHDLHHRQRGA